MARRRIQVNRPGAAQLLHAPGLVADLQGRMAAVQRVYGEPTVMTTRVLSSGRAIVTVTDTRADALWRESWTGDLARALSAAGASREPVGAKWGPRRQWGPGLRFPRKGTR